MSLTFGLFIQVSDSWPHGPFVLNCKWSSIAQSLSLSSFYDLSLSYWGSYTNEKTAEYIYTKTTDIFQVRRQEKLRQERRRQEKLIMTSQDLDPVFVKALRLMHSKSKESGDQLRQMLDDLIAQRKGLMQSKVHMFYYYFYPVLIILKTARYQ